MTAIEKLSTLGVAPIYDRYYPLSTEEITVITGMLGKSLPQRYLELVNAYGCAYFPGREIVINSLTPPPPDLSDDNQLSLSSLFGGGTEKHRLLQQVVGSRGDLPNDLIPIASDYSGNLYCLSIDGVPTGPVFFWDGTRLPLRQSSERIPTEEGSSDELHLFMVASNLEDFIDRMHSP